MIDMTPEPPDGLQSGHDVNGEDMLGHQGGAKVYHRG